MRLALTVRHPHRTPHFTTFDFREFDCQASCQESSSGRCRQQAKWTHSLSFCR